MADVTEVEVLAGLDVVIVVSVVPGVGCDGAVETVTVGGGRAALLLEGGAVAVTEAEISLRMGFGAIDLLMVDGIRGDTGGIIASSSSGTADGA